MIYLISGKKFQVNPATNSFLETFKIIQSWTVKLRSLSSFIEGFLGPREFPHPSQGFPPIPHFSPGLPMVHLCEVVTYATTISAATSTTEWQKASGFGCFNLENVHFRQLTYPRWWFQIFFMFTPIWGRWTHFDFYFSNGLVQPPTSIRPQEQGKKTFFHSDCKVKFPWGYFFALDLVSMSW